VGDSEAHETTAQNQHATVLLNQGMVRRSHQAAARVVITGARQVARSRTTHQRVSAGQ
jgi:hypothetical protein